MSTAKQWLFILRADGYQTIKLDHSPDGWDEQLVTITRSPSYYGLVRTRSVGLRFLKDGYDWIQNVYEKEGTEFQIYIDSYEYVEKPVDKFRLFFPGIVDLSTYNVGENFVEVDINETSLARKFMSRDDVKINMSKTTSIEGVELGPNEPVINQINEREISLRAVYKKDENVSAIGTTLSLLDANVSGVVAPMTIDTSNIDNLVLGPAGNIDSQSSIFYNKLDENSYITIKGNLNCTLSNGPGNISGVRHVAFRNYDDTLSSYTEEIIYSTPGENYEPVTFINIDIDLSFSIDPDRQLAFVIYANQPDFYQVRFFFTDLTINQNVIYETTESPGHLILETGERICEAIADQTGVFKSNLLGRIDAGYEVDGKAAYQIIHSGKQIRNIPDSYPAISLKDYFDSLNAQRNVGLGIEYDSTNQPYFRLEEKEHFFSGEVIATIHNVTELTKKVAREWIYSGIEVGYEKAEYEFLDGLLEYNNKFEWTNSAITTIKNLLSLISKFRADGIGIEKIRRLQYKDFPTTDSKEDNDIFITTVHNIGEKYTTDGNENYDLVENVYSPETATNLDLSPGRMFRRSGDLVRAGSEKYIDKEIVFDDAEQFSGMISQRTGEEVINESENIVISDLKSPRWICEEFGFKSKLSRELLQVITKKPQGIIKFSTKSKENTTQYFYMWILKVEAETEGGEANWTGLRVNLSSPDVVLIDPDGNSPDPLPPDNEDITGVFEGDFPWVFAE